MARKSKILDSKGKPAKINLDDFSAVWSSKLNSANRKFNAWEDKYRCDETENAFYGHQWDKDLVGSYEPYVTNEILAAIQVKLPSLLFKNPTFQIKPKPSKGDFDIDAVSKRAKLRQDVLGHLIPLKTTRFFESTQDATLEGFFRFGVCEVGYSADWVDNPEAGKPLLDEDITKDIDPDAPEIIQQPKKLPKNERIFVKNIPAGNFRVGDAKIKRISQQPWVGYFEWFRKSDIIATFGKDAEKGFTSISGEDFANETSVFEDILDDEDSYGQQKEDQIKVWKIWDNRAGKKYIFLGTNGFLLKTTSFKRVPLFTLRYIERLNRFYPLPPVYNWISPQMEMNETREAARAHRRRFVRKYISGAEAFEESELYKLQNGGDGTVARCSYKDPKGSLIPMPDANLGAHHSEMLQVSNVDFDRISGVTPEQRGIAQSSTATQANVIDQRTSIRDSFEQAIVANFLCDVAKEVLLQAKERLTNDLVISIKQDNVDEQTPIGEIQGVLESWEVISTDALGDEDFEVTIQLDSMSPVANQRQKEKFMEFLAILDNFNWMSLSPVLVREAANKVGYTNEAVIAEIQRMALLQLSATRGQLEQINAQQELQGQQLAINEGENELAQREAAQNTPNTQEQIRNQVANQAV